MSDYGWRRWTLNSSTGLRDWRNSSSGSSNSHLADVSGPAVFAPDGQICILFVLHGYSRKESDPSLVFRSPFLRYYLILVLRCYYSSLFIIRNIFKHQQFWKFFIVSELGVLYIWSLCWTNGVYPDRDLGDLCKSVRLPGGYGPQTLSLFITSQSRIVYKNQRWVRATFFWARNRNSATWRKLFRNRNSATFKRNVAPQLQFRNRNFSEFRNLTA
jgi:hypothetical protein